MRPFLILLLSFSWIASANAQWILQQSHTTANLRGIHNAGHGMVWASGANGTVLHSTDNGETWQKCPTPPTADTLDFRAIWAWDANNAIVMSSGPGDQSRIYKTDDACHTWTLQLTNSEKDGFWDAMVFQSGDFGFLGDAKTGMLIGDPVHSRFQTEAMVLGHGWFFDDSSCVARPGEAAFAASNSSVFVFGSRRYIIGTGGKGGPRALLSPLLAYRDHAKPCLAAPVPLAGGTESTGVFSLAFRDLKHGIAVGGDYKQPTASSGTAAWTSDGGKHWSAASKPPHGYRSSVAWLADKNVWIAIGTNGSDISFDDGKTWKSLNDGNWNALSLPFVVGPSGRIARLDPAWLKR